MLDETYARRLNILGVPFDAVPLVAELVVADMVDEVLVPDDKTVCDACGPLACCAWAVPDGFL
jgi:hypothetical protein